MVRFLAQEAASGVLLLIATAVALIWANSPWSESYHHLWETEVDLAIGSWMPFLHDDHGLSLELWVNDALMVLFFFVVGLEIKSELVVGDLRDPKIAALPAIGAIGGMVIPAALFAAVNIGGDGLGGWGIPMATDIAFAVGVLALLGNSIPRKLKLFLLTLAIVDDIGAILVIAIFYTSSIHFDWLIYAILGLVAVVAMQRMKIWYTPIYVIVGVFVWYATFRSGVHATIAGVALGMLTPAKPLVGQRRFESLEDMISGDTADPAGLRNANWKLRESVSVCSRQLSLVSPWTSFFVIPIFALANAGVSLSSEAISEAISSRVSLGIVLGLVIGKPLGIYVFSMFATRSGLAVLPEGVNMRHVLGAGAVAGIGFTVALFINNLAFVDNDAIKDQATLGILFASVAASIVGALILRGAPPAESLDDSVGGADSEPVEAAV